MKKPRILIYDIETSPNIGYCWGKWEQNIIEYVREWEILSVAWKWEGEITVQVKTQADYRGKGDKGLCKQMLKLFDKADIVVAHNGDKFDQKKVRTRMLYWDLNPPSTFATVDTCKVARKHFALNSNKLDDLGEYLGIGRKAKHPGFSMWIGCMADNKASWAAMAKYNKQDVVLLARVYQRLKKWMDNHPSVALLGGHNGCPFCGSTQCVKKGVRATHRTLKQQWLCKDCGGWHLTPIKRIKV